MDVAQEMDEARSSTNDQSKDGKRCRCMSHVIWTVNCLCDLQGLKSNLSEAEIGRATDRNEAICKADAGGVRIAT